MPPWRTTGMPEFRTPRQRRWAEPGDRREAGIDRSVAVRLQGFWLALLMPELPVATARCWPTAVGEHRHSTGRNRPVPVSQPCRLTSRKLTVQSDGYPTSPLDLQGTKSRRPVDPRIQ